MTSVTRYTLETMNGGACMEEEPQGEWVRYADVAAEIERLRAIIAGCPDCEEVERAGVPGVIKGSNPPPQSCG